MGTCAVPRSLLRWLGRGMRYTFARYVPPVPNGLDSGRSAMMCAHFPAYRLLQEVERRRDLRVASGPDDQRSDRMLRPRRAAMPGRATGAELAPGLSEPPFFSAP